MESRVAKESGYALGDKAINDNHHGSCLLTSLPVAILPVLY